MAFRSHLATEEEKEWESRGNGEGVTKARERAEKENEWERGRCGEGERSEID